MIDSESYRLATQELKRADHSIAVSLKYTRTVDVIKSIIQRLINSISLGLSALLEEAKKQGKIAEVPELPRLKIEQSRKLYPKDEVIQNFCDFFLLLRKIDKADFKRANEFRRNVTMSAYLDDGSTIEVTIDIITDYYERTKECLNYIAKMISGRDE
ncbi:hypothetical protein KY329_04190 [Candidatus Woesearchaeota archaeon]|nr:hypothetical protein [Candidatus Woesearchaeota archaeon]